MAGVNARELRNHLRHYLDRLEEGEEFAVIRNSKIIGRLVPTGQIQRVGEKASNVYQLSDTREVKFRQFGSYEDGSPVMELHKAALEPTGAYVEDPSLDSDLYGPGDTYPKMGGEFWVGELDGNIMAMGGFWIHLSGPDKEAELKRMRVIPDLQGQGIGSALLKLLEGRAKLLGFETMALDATSAESQLPARQFYEKHGYQETGRMPAKNFELIYYRKQL